MELDYEYLNIYPLLKQYNLTPLKNKLYRCFNPSIVKIKKDCFLYSFRIRIQEKEQGDELIPGNISKCGVDIGKNFWWGRWNHSSSSDITVFVLKYNDVYSLLEIENQVNTNFYQRQYIDDYYMSVADIRLLKYKGKIYLHDSELKYIIELKVLPDKLIMGESINLYPGNGHNRQIISIGDNIVYLDYYDYKGVKVIIDDIDFYKNTSYIPYSGNPIYLEGSTDNLDPKAITLFKANYGIMPKFSFSTPLVEIDKNKFLGVGHIKIFINPDIKYVSGSKIERFRDTLEKYMSSKFHIKYIRHYGTGDCVGYIYMMYFYILEVNDALLFSKNNMFLSDAYLPINMKEKNVDSIHDKDYKFSLVFPTGLCKDNNDVIVTCGEGDFYAIELKLNLSEVVDVCSHNVRDINMEDYGYYILEHE